MRHLWIFLFLTACAGVSRDCASCSASNYGADWIVITNGADGHIVNCWKLSDTAIDNEPHTDGIFWEDSTTKHLVHISGWYSRVQVTSGQYKTAAAQLGVDLDRCVGGKYEDKTEK